MLDTPNTTAHRIQAEGNSSVQPVLVQGSNLHKVLANGILYLGREGSSQNQASQEERLWFYCVHKYLKEKFEVSLLATIKDVPLKGFAFTTDDFMSDVNCWSGKADAIGLLDGGEDDFKYVIVDWKTKRSTSNTFWERGDQPSVPYRDHLTQCLVYARLLKMHFRLDYWPPILIVPFNLNGVYMHPRLFTDYPVESKRAIEKYQWSTNPPLRFNNRSALKDTVEEGLLPGDMKLTDVFKEDATVDDLCKALKVSDILV